MCIVDMNPLANCIGCIFGSSEPKSILYIFSVTSIAFCLQSLFKTNPRAFYWEHHICVQVCIFRYLCGVCLYSLVSVSVSACASSATAVTFFTANSLRMNPSQPTPPTTQTRTQTHHVHCDEETKTIKKEMKEFKTGGRRRKQTLASLDGEQMEPREGREEEE